MAKQKRRAGPLIGGWLLLAGVAAAQEPALPLPPPPPPSLTAVGFEALPGWEEDALAAALQPFLASCGAWAQMPAERGLGVGGPAADLGITPASWRQTCTEAQALARDLPVARPPRRGRPPTAAAERAAATERQRLVRDFLQRRLVPYSAGPGLLTGYYEPELRGNDYPRGAFQVPLHAPPPPAIRDRAPDRAAIEQGALDGLGLEVAWVDDPADAYFLHIQGSGRVLLPDGRTLRVGYAGQNGHPFRSIWRALYDRGLLARAEGSMQAIRAWLVRADPGLATAMLRDNPSYIYFRVVEGLRPDQGPIGALGVPLTPERSMAVDFGFIPMGAPVFVAPRHPVTGRPYPRLMLAQDQGGAIRGPARGDVFWGWGGTAAELAGRFYDTPEMFVLLPRGAAPELEAVAEATAGE